MPTLRFTATKMSEAKVSHISLVERGANRIPFKVVKEESDTMSKFSGLDLGGLFARKAEKTPEVPQVIGIITMKGESLETVQKAAAEAGFAVDASVEMEDGTVVFKQEGFSDEALADGVVVRLSESVALVTKGFSPYNMDITADGVTFADQCAASGFYPAINSIMTTLSDAVRSVVYNAKTPAEAKSGVTKLFAEASAYTASFVGGLPVKAFKMEDLAVGIPLVVEKAYKPGDKEGAAEGAAAGEETDPLKKEAAKTKKDEAEGGAAAEGKGAQEHTAEQEEVIKAAMSADEKTFLAGLSGGDKMKFMKATSEERAKIMESAAKPAKKDETALTEGKVAVIVASKVTEATSELATKFEQLIASLGSVQKSVEGFAATAEDLKIRTEKAEKIAADSVKAVKGTVVVGSESGDVEPMQPAQKSEMRGDIDTAFQPRRAFPSKR